MAVDWNDPCARFAALNTAYFTLISGGKVASAEYDGKKIQFSLANIGLLASELAKAEDACRVANGMPSKNRRSVIEAGSRRDFGFAGPFGV